MSDANESRRARLNAIPYGPSICGKKVMRELTPWVPAHENFSKKFQMLTEGQNKKGGRGSRSSSRLSITVAGMNATQMTFHTTIVQVRPQSTSHRLTPATPRARHIDTTRSRTPAPSKTNATRYESARKVEVNESVIDPRTARAERSR